MKNAAKAMMLAAGLSVAMLGGCKCSQKSCRASDKAACCGSSACEGSCAGGKACGDACCGGATTASLTERDAMLFEPLKALGGSWGMDMQDGNGLQKTAEFSVTSANSVIREIMFPGHDHEMTNVYHMDGPNLVITHYCAAGNQPRMIATTAQKTDAGLVYHFKVDRVSNVREGQHGVMNELIMTLHNDGHVQQDWYATDPATGSRVGPTQFILTRIGQ